MIWLGHVAKGGFIVVVGTCGLGDSGGTTPGGERGECTWIRSCESSKKQI